MTTRRAAPRTSVTKTNGFSACLSPPLWKDQLRQRCLARLKQNRHELLAKLRSPDANIADEMKRLVFKEEQRKMGSSVATRGSARGSSGARHLVFDEPVEDAAPEDDQNDGDLVTIEDLMVSGQLSEQDYLDIVHSLEDELRNEWDADEEDERFAEEMIKFEEASLAAMLAGMDLDGASVPQKDQDVMVSDDALGWDIMVDATEDIRVLCPICKAGSLSEITDGASHAIVSCSCGFSLRVKQHILHGALEDLQAKISDAYMGHRDECPVDPTFAVFSDLDDDYEVTDSLLMSCGACGHECLVR